MFRKKEYIYCIYSYIYIYSIFFVKVQKGKIGKGGITF